MISLQLDRIQGPFLGGERTTRSVRRWLGSRWRCSDHSWAPTGMSLQCKARLGRGARTARTARKATALVQTLPPENSSRHQSLYCTYTSWYVLASWACFWRFTPKQVTKPGNFLSLGENILSGSLEPRSISEGSWPSLCHLPKESPTFPVTKV